MEKIRKTVYIDIDNMTEIENRIKNNIFGEKNIMSEIVNNALRHYFYDVRINIKNNVI